MDDPWFYKLMAIIMICITIAAIVDILATGGENLKVIL